MSIRQTIYLDMGKREMAELMDALAVKQATYDGTKSTTTMRGKQALAKLCTALEICFYDENPTEPPYCRTASCTCKHFCVTAALKLFCQHLNEELQSDETCRALRSSHCTTGPVNGGESL